MKLTPHEEKILKIIRANPKVVNQPSVREKIANKHGLTEKTLRNRIAELRKRGLLEKESKNNPVKIKPLVTENDEINISALIDLTKRKKKFFLKFSFLTTSIGLIYSLLATVFFASKISLYPAGELVRGGGSLGEFSGLAKSFGLSAFGSAPTYNIPDIINSRKLKKDIVLKPWKTSKNKDKINLISFWEIGKPSFFSPLSKLRKLLPAGNSSTSELEKNTDEAILQLDELIGVKEEISGLISVTVLMEDPQLASDIANYIAEYVKRFISIEQKLEATRNRKFIEQQMKEAKLQNEISEDLLTEFRKKNLLRLDTPSLEMKRERLESAVEENRAVYITLRQQFEIAKIDESKEKLLINILDTAEPAVKKAKPKRTIIVLLSFFAGLVFAVPVAIYLDKRKL
tara:strand:+ start:1288 stop:2490 length:1203 start_codon:yes stop_codon:yes gene_type:complete